MNKCQDPFASTPTQTPPKNPTPSEKPEKPKESTKPTKDDSVDLSKNNFTPITIRGKTHYVRKGYEDTFSAPPPEKPKTARELRQEKRDQLKKDRMEAKKKVG